MTALPPALLVAVLLAGLIPGQPARAQAAGSPTKLRLIIETDAGGDPDDEQSLVRFLLYANEWDIEGILCTRPQTLRGENKNAEPTGLAIVQRLLRAYKQVHPRLRQHAAFPAPDILLARTVAGYDDRDDGVRLLIAAVDSDDPRPVWFSNWGTNDGTTSSLQRALDQVLKERGADGYARFKDRLRLCSDDRFGPHTTSLDPPWKLWVYTKFPDMDGGRWYHRFGPLTATAGGFDLQRDLLTNHGPLAALYPTNTHLPQKEGDTPEFLYLVPNGLNEPEQPGWGSWAGRFGRQPDAGSRAYYWPDVRDTIDGRDHRDHTLIPWAAHIQNDFRARLDWCVHDFGDANHPPHPVVAGALQRTATAGSRVSLDATGTTDPDGDGLDFAWRHYPEPSGYRGPPVALEGSDKAIASFAAPAVTVPATLHLILAATDRGDPPLTRYARVVVTVKPAGQ